MFSNAKRHRTAGSMEFNRELNAGGRRSNDHYASGLDLLWAAIL